jgi:hypothetical protein
MWTSNGNQFGPAPELLADPKAIHEPRVLLAEQVGKFTMERLSENGEVSFKANRKIDFFGEEAFTQLSGAGGPVCTVRAHQFSLSITY